MKKDHKLQCTSGTISMDQVFSFNADSYSLLRLPLPLFGLPAYSHHDRFPPWWVFVRDDNGGNLSGDKIPPLMMIIINHLTQFNSSH